MRMIISTCRTPFDRGCAVMSRKKPSTYQSTHLSCMYVSKFAFRFIFCLCKSGTSVVSQDSVFDGNLALGRNPGQGTGGALYLHPGCEASRCKVVVVDISDTLLTNNFAGQVQTRYNNNSNTVGVRWHCCNEGVLYGCCKEGALYHLAETYRALPSVGICPNTLHKWPIIDTPSIGFKA